MRILLRAVAFAAAVAPVTLGVNSASAQSDDRIPILRVAPNYPARALQRGEDGEVTLRFTIAVDGTTKDIEVVGSSAPQFERPAVVALGKWRYRPQTENGVLVETRGVQTVIRFSTRS